eukprot:3939475-Rhodomonas_salina.2
MHCTPPPTTHTHYSLAQLPSSALLRITPPARPHVHGTCGRAGKGFGYVEFATEEGVTQALLLSRYSPAPPYAYPDIPRVSGLLLVSGTPRVSWCPTRAVASPIGTRGTFAREQCLIAFAWNLPPEYLGKVCGSWYPARILYAYPGGQQRTDVAYASRLREWCAVRGTESAYAARQARCETRHHCTASPPLRVCVCASMPARVCVCTERSCMRMPLCLRVSACACLCLSV